uniref:Uncharacterized protein n=1 Tax=Catagonus wagneri TaxID=51154 RepID=A0A8C3W2Q2_9CETA
MNEQNGRRETGRKEKRNLRSPPCWGWDCGSRAGRNPKAPAKIAACYVPAFQDVFKLFSSSPAGTVDMRSMKAALCNAGVHLSPQMCEALGQADLDGDGSIGFKDFLGVLTDSHRLAQCLGEGNDRLCDPHDLQTLFLEMIFKLMSLGFVPYKSAQELMSYYSKNTGRSHAGLAFFCQATHPSDLSNAELARALQGLRKAGAPRAGPYSEIPNLNGRMQPECYRQNRTPSPEVQLPKSYRPSRPKHRLDCDLTPPAHPLCAYAGFLGQPLGCVRPSKMAPFPPILVQRQPFCPPPACLQRSAMKTLYK